MDKISDPERTAGYYICRRQSFETRVKTLALRYTLTEADVIKIFVNEQKKIILHSARFYTKEIEKELDGLFLNPIYNLLIWRIVEQELKLAEVKEESFKDFLTGLFNRGAFTEALERKARHYSRESHDTERGSPFSLILFDLDHFKAINDTYGHPVGDSVLKAIADTVKELARRPEDFFARIGGEEFAIIIDGNLGSVQKFAEQVRLSISSIDIQSLGINPEWRKTITASFGVCQYELVDNDIQKSIQHLYEEADKSLYTAKNTGRNRVCS